MSVPKSGAAVVVAPGLRHGDRLVWRFDEDLLTAAWDAVQGLPEGTAVHVQGLDLPPWWLQGTGLRVDADGPWTLTAAGTEHGQVVVLHPSDAAHGHEAAARAALERATPLDEEALRRLEDARGEVPREADFPLGAHVIAPRHEALTSRRMRLPPGQVVTWTTIGAGAAPTEFHRLQEAEGAYHVVLVQAGTERTVGIWSGTSAPVTGQPVRPVLRRLLLQQGAWRHGVKFAPLGGEESPGPA